MVTRNRILLPAETSPPGRPLRFICRDGLVLPPTGAYPPLQGTGASNISKNSLGIFSGIHIKFLA